MSISVERWLTPHFQQAVINNPVQAARNAGIDLSPDQEQWLSGNPEQWRNFVQIIGGAKGAGGVTPLDCNICVVDGH
jgi:hypothetical protein